MVFMVFSSHSDSHPDTILRIELRAIPTRNHTKLASRTSNLHISSKYKIRNKTKTTSENVI